MKDTTVTLPAGMQLSPSAADGLQACSNAQIGFERAIEELDQFRYGSRRSFKREALQRGDRAGRSDAVSGRVEDRDGEDQDAAVGRRTGRLGVPGGAAELRGPAGKPVLLARRDVSRRRRTGDAAWWSSSRAGSRRRTHGCTGQITTTFENTPQLPFSDLKLEFYGTDRAPLATPAFCGTYETEASLAPWSGRQPTVSPAADLQHRLGSERERVHVGPRPARCRSRRRWRRVRRTSTRARSAT